MFKKVKKPLAIRRNALLFVTACLLASCGQQNADTSGKDWLDCREKTHALENSGRFADAEDLLSGFLKTHNWQSSASAEVSQCLDESARLYMHWDQPAKALPLLERLVAIKENFHGGDYLGLPWNLSQMADAYYAQNMWQKAAPIYMRAAVMFTSLGCLADSIPTFRKAANCYRHQAQYKQAELLYAKALDYANAYRIAPGHRLSSFRLDDATALTLADFAKLKESEHQSQEASALNLHAQTIWRRLIQASDEPDKFLPETNYADMPPASGQGQSKADNLSEASPILGLSLQKIAQYYCQKGKFADAEDLVERMFEVRKDMPDFAQANAEGRQTKLAQIYAAWHQLQITTPLYLISSQDGNAGKPSVANPYLKEFAEIRSRQEYFDKKPTLCHIYAWAVPSDEALAALAAHGPIVEIGAGTGYWSYLLKQSGVKISPYDIAPVPTHANLWQFRASRQWTAVGEGNETMVKKHPDDNLFLCWPPGNDPCAYNALSFSKGNYLFYIGEMDGTLTQSKEFSQLLQEKWLPYQEVDIPQWPGMYDALFIYRRQI